MNKKTKKRLWRWGTLLLVVILAVWVQSRWHAWFHNPEEQPYTPLTVPHRVLLTFGDENESSRNVSWQCDTILQRSYLELLCLDDDSICRAEVEAKGEVFASRQGKAAFYVARLRNLEPDKHYKYRAISGKKASEWYDFRTYPEHRQKASFLYVGDVQDTLGGITNRILHEALKRHPEGELLVCGGDFVERPRNEDWTEAFNDIDSVAQHIPMLCVTGNHDYLKAIIMELERRFTLTFSYFLDSKIDDNHVYTLSYGPIQFFLLDSNREFPYLYSQRQWLKSKLAESRAPWKIVVLHHPLYSVKGKNNNLIQRWMFDDIIREYGVDMVMQGHEHAYARVTAKDDGGQQVTPVYTISHCSPKNYKIDPGDRFDKIDKQGRYYQIVSISGDTLTMRAYETEGHSLIDSLSIIKDQNIKKIQL